MLIGRFMGAAELSDLGRRNKQLLLAAFPIAGFLVLWAARGWDAVQITAGLKAGEVVVLDPPSALGPGTQVQIQTGKAGS